MYCRITPAGHCTVVVQYVLVLIPPALMRVVILVLAEQLPATSNCSLATVCHCADKSPHLIHVHATMRQLKCDLALLHSLTGLQQDTAQ